MQPKQAGYRVHLLTFLLVVGYGAFFLLLHQFLFEVGLTKTGLSPNVLCQWDCHFYRDIANVGYQDKEGANNAAFYPLFSLLWRWLHLNELGASCLNILFFAGGFTVFSSLYHTTWAHKLVFLTLPGVYFMFIPYTEALFFLLSATLMWGVARQKNAAVFASVFVIALTRPSVLMLLPALLAMEILGNEKRNILIGLRHWLSYQLLPALLGTALFVWYQHHETGVWMFYFYLQTKYWAHIFRWPVFPLGDMFGTNKTLWMSAVAYFGACIAVVLLLVWAVKWLFTSFVADKLMVLATTFITLSLYFLVFYSPTWGGVTLTISSRRYLMINTYFFALLHYCTHKFTYKAWHYVAVGLACTLFWMAFGSFVHIVYAATYLVPTALVLLYMATSSRRHSWPATVLIALSFFIQMTFFQLILNGDFTDL
ncbi:MAG: hypothetical protein EBZ77_07115 [Chitinophagia bacterium]|nr:hypothetical protein [Chitinophagia bacterium]